MVAMVVMAIVVMATVPVSGPCAQMTKSTAGGFVCLSQRVDSEQELVTGGVDGQLFFWDCDVVDAVGVSTPLQL